MIKKRLDQLLVEKEMAETMAKARALVLAGQVLVDGQRVDKPGTPVSADAAVRLKEGGLKYVSRGGLKLEHALVTFEIDPAKKIGLDVGVSTGGFTDCLLQHGAKKIYAVDVGYGQLAWKLRQDPRVILLERENIRHLPREKIPEPVDIAVIDVSFISLKPVFPAIKPFLAPSASIVALVKPQFEVSPEKVGKGGIIKDPALHDWAVAEIRQTGIAAGWAFQGATPSPILGAEGNREFLVWFNAR